MKEKLSNWTTSPWV